VLQRKAVEVQLRKREKAKFRSQRRGRTETRLEIRSSAARGKRFSPSFFLLLKFFKNSNAVRTHTTTAKALGKRQTRKPPTRTAELIGLEEFKWTEMAIVLPESGQLLMSSDGGSECSESQIFRGNLAYFSEG
jgi:hypothetical protein